MEFKVGSKVQAVDELGRWANGIIQEIDQDSNEATVYFVGWDSDCNVTNPLSKIRKPVDIFESQIGSVKSGKRSCPEKRFLPFFRTMERGDRVKYETEGGVVEGTVEEVDAFQRRVILDDGVSIHGSQLVFEKESTPEPKRRRVMKRVKQCQKPRSHDVSCDTASLGEDTFAIEEAAEETPAFHFAVNEDGTRLQVGDVVKLIPQGLLFAISKIQKEANSFFVCGLLVAEGKLDNVTIRTPISRVVAVCEKPDKRLKAALGRMREDSYRGHKKMLQSNFSYRMAIRKMQMRHLCRKEITAGLNSSVGGKKFLIGMVCIELDDPIILHGRSRQVFSIKTGTMQELDGLLGRRWDILLKGNMTRFVTEMAFVVSDSGTLSARMSFASCLGSPSDDYRQFLLTNIQSTGFGAQL